MEETIKNNWITFVETLQDAICLALEDSDGVAKFKQDNWQRVGGGGGKTRVLENGKVFEKAGVNTSVVFGAVSDAMRSQLKIEGSQWFACGLSLVIHPKNPMVPTVHANYRMFELYNIDGILADRWFGGGTDLTPYYLFEEDARHFHGTYKNICDKYDSGFYADFKKHCDNYFVNSHRENERRGIGGIFYDYQKPSDEKDINFWINFAKDCGYGFIDAYIPIVEKRKELAYTEEQVFWQQLRRGRYVEFNLIHDRGTIFGLKTGGRTESILMSLPPIVRFNYDNHPEPGSEEDKLLQVCLQPKEWV